MIIITDLEVTSLIVDMELDSELLVISRIPMRKPSNEEINGNRTL